MVAKVASHIFIFCMDRTIIVINILNVEIVNGEKNKLCMIYLADLVLHLE